MSLPNVRVASFRLMQISALAILLFGLLITGNQVSAEAAGASDQSDLHRLVLTAEEAHWVARHPVIRVGVDPEFAPFEFIDDTGHYRGLAADYVALLEQRLGLTFAVVPDLTWAEVMVETRGGNIDLLPGVGKTEERQGYLSFTEPYTDFVRSIITRSEQAHSVTGLDSLQGLRVGVQADSSHAGYLRDHSTITPITYVTLQAALIALSIGEVDALVGNISASIYWMRRLNLINLRIAAQVSSDIQHLHFASRQDWPMLNTLLQKGLDSISVAEKMAISRRWIDVGELLPKPAPVKVNLSAQQLAWLQDHPVIKIGIDSAWPPIEFVTHDDEFLGISSEYVKYFSQVLGVKFEPLLGLSWDQVMESTRNGKIDLLPAVARTEEREKYLNFTRSYVNYPLVIFTRNGADYLNGLDDLRGKQVLVETSYMVHELLLENHPELILVEVPDTETALLTLIKGGADAYVGNLMVASSIIGNRGYTGLKVAAPTDYSYDLSIGVRKDWPEMIPILQRALDSMTPQQKTAIQQKWVAIRYDVDVDYGLLRQVVLVALLILMLGCLWLFQVRRQRERLRISDERFQFAMAASDGIWDWDIASGDVYYSPRYFSMLGYGSGELRHRHRTWEGLLHADDRNAALAVVEQAVAESKSQYEHQFRLKCRDGSYRNIHSRGHVVDSDSHGKALRVVGIQTDITDRVVAEEHLQIYQRFAATSGQGFAIATLDGQVTYVNETLWQLVGESSAETMCEGDYGRFFREPLVELFQGEIGKTLEQNRQWVGELEML
ncbi:MAG: transporter substrate-binding domain-containing protein, partial [Immundisolibacteraceae bacterium]|nr:transporter substrate-binding domain-containing protein [Immundisolibacteraceae bacterium]